VGQMRIRHDITYIIRSEKEEQKKVTVVCDTAGLVYHHGSKVKFTDDQKWGELKFDNLQHDLGEFRFRNSEERDSDVCKKFEFSKSKHPPLAVVPELKKYVEHMKGNFSFLQQVKVETLSNGNVNQNGIDFSATDSKWETSIRLNTVKVRKQQGK